MRRLLIAAALAAALFSPAVLAPAPAAAACYGSVYVNEHYRADGTYVQGYYRSCPDNSTSNNWSESGYRHPYSGGTGSGYHPRYSGYERFYP